MGATLAVTLTLGAASASAAIVHPFLSSFDGSATPGGSFTADGVTVDNDPSSPSAGDVYITDSKNDLVDKFSSSGSYVCQITGAGSASTSASECDSTDPGVPSGHIANASVPNAVDPTTGDFWLAQNGEGLVDEFSPSGEYLSQITVPNGGQADALAVDAAGDVFISDPSNGVIDEYDPSTSTTTTFATGTPSGSFGRVRGVAVDDDPSSPAFGDVYVIDRADEAVDVFNSAGVFQSSITGPPSGSFSFLASVTVDPGSGDLYVADQGTNLVDEFDPTGNFVTDIQLPGAGVPSDVAINAATGDVYVGDITYARVDTFGPQALAPDVTTGQASGVTVTGATLNGTVDPDGTMLTDCHFEYVDDADYDAAAVDPYSAGGSVPCSSTPSGSSPVAVSASVSGLTPGVVYHFQLVAANAQAPNDGGDQTFATGSVSSGEYVTGVSADAATLHAQVNPEGLDTTYQFDYGTTTSYGQTTPESPSIGSGSSGVAVSALATGLQPNTEYHYRVAATNSAGTSYGPDQTFTTQPTGAFSLPDGRAYEMVTPADKDGGEVSFQYSGGVSANAGIPLASSPDGNEVTYGSVTAFPGASSAPPTVQYISTRGAGGWSTQSIAPPSAAQATPVLQDPYWGFSPDLSYGLLAQEDPTLAAGAAPGFFNVYLRDNATGTYTTLSDATPTGVGTGYDAFPAGASADFSHVIFTAQGALTPNAPPSTGAANAGQNLYESSGGQLQLVSIFPDGTPATPDSDTGFGSGGQLSSANSDVENAISADGSKVFWTAGPGSGDPGLYVRIDGTSTVQVDAPQGGTSNNGSVGEYWDASTDGSEVIFTDSNPLTAESKNQGSSDLYEYDVDTGTLTDLTVGDGTANVEGVLGASDDLSYIYFVADGVLAPGATQDTHCGSGGPCNLYVWHDGATKFIATLSGDDGTDWLDTLHDASAVGPQGKTAMVTADGLHLAFVANESLTGYDNTDAEPGATCSKVPSTGVPLSTCNEVYLYDAAGSGQLTCVSCNPTGERPTGQASVPGWSSDLTPPEYLTDDGDRVFFDSRDALLAHATNGLQNVYEWERDGTGSCATAPGCVYLISTGTSSDDSSFLAASASGDDVFFITRQQLVPEDVDQSMDVYDARVGGGFPYAAPPPPCSGDACRGPLGGAPAPPTAASVTFTGPGNASPPGRVKVLTKVVHGTSFLIRVRVPAAGRVTVSGAGVKRISRVFAHAHSYQIRAALTSSARGLLRRKRKLKLTVRVGYAPAGGQPQAAIVRLTVERALRNQSRHARRDQGGLR